MNRWMTGQRALGRLLLLGVWLCSGLCGWPVARADAPAGMYTVTADTVKDNRTGLTWQRAASSQTMNWQAAQAYCTNGWRLPNVRELQSLVDIRRAFPAIDISAFPNTPEEAFWSSSPIVDDAWFVSFRLGEVGFSAITDTSRVRCVR